MSTCRTRVGVAALTIALGGFAGCTGDSSTSELSPNERLAAAKTALDETPGVRISLKADKLPSTVSGLVAAQGIGTHAPAFSGDIQVVTGGITATADVIAVGGKVWAVMPFTTDYAPIDPADFQAPDPAELMSPDEGLSSLLTSVDSVTEGEQVRDGQRVLSTYTGTLPGDVVAGVIPSADADAAFDASFTLADDDRLAEVTMTGPFYPDAEPVTYTVAFTQYGVEKDITAP